ncbi:MAG: site-specific DNA-methyltransferase [Gemmatimonadetes bacterium]|nr:site-specific DNA-methyltransferase [Gemmatimonadota bacterium]
MREIHAEQPLRVATVRDLVARWVESRSVAVNLGLPEWDDRLNRWRVPLVSEQNGSEPIGEVQVSSSGDIAGSTDLDLCLQRERLSTSTEPKTHSSYKGISFTPIPSKVILGDARTVLVDFPPNTAQLVFTSPPYFNAKPESHESLNYEHYLDFLRDVFKKCHAILSEGRFLVVNTSPVLMRRTSRASSSKRLPIPYDLHPILRDIGFDFIDDIIWEKPEGAGWNLGRGRRFAADRQPLQYKAVSVTENVMVYRKKTDKLIDWNIRNHPFPEAVKASKIKDGYERTNVWKLHPASHKLHPAVFPDALAERVIRYYSFEGDLVLDPFAGTGTTGRVAGGLGRRFLMIENSSKYFEIQASDSTLMQFKPDLYDFQYDGVAPE